ncbi:hypothetical protein H6G33_09385 [Calothrix sp. FACHB-1219]|uniref:hypothetical protein n=1 Tax=unclassified Calothrix TaxID=2619626 RepID=UPI001684C766|nr:MULTISPECIES: hypothetical protein [unclassified Calothrix]MBD2201558.1 hypothetical protein [Calothrix sp. FACHB-168]MBD2217244.1 hypothetical protein [Calothrix sp. FACHB-1219]
MDTDISKEELLEDSIDQVISQTGSFSQEEALYTNESPLYLSNRSIKCETCSYYYENACSVVEGSISPQGYCRLWIKKEIEDISPKEEVYEDILESRLYFSQGMLKIPIAKKGNFYHEKYGQVKFDDYEFNSVLSNFENDALGFTSYITYGHSTDPEYEAVDAELKKGELQKLSIEDNILYGLYSCPEDTYKLVLNGEYEYVSPELIRNFKSKETGENLGVVLTRVALTNSPFIPFRDLKVQALSVNASEEIDNSKQNDCPQSRSVFMIKLSIDDTNLTSSDIEMSQQNNNVETVTEAVNAVLEATGNTVTGIAPTATIPTPILEQPIQPAIVTTSSTSVVEEPQAKLDVAALIKQVTDNLSIAYEKQLEAMKAQNSQLIEGLNSKIADLSNALNKQQEISQAFSTSVAKAERTARYSKLVDQGMPASFIERFSQIESALDSNSNVIKLSTAAGNEESKSVLEVITSLVMDAIKTEPVTYEQFGQSISSPTGLEASMKEIIQSNKDKATKLKLGQ